MSFSEASTVGELLADPAATAVLEKHMPGISTHAMIGMAQGFSLQQLAGFPQVGLTPDKLAALGADLAQLG